MHNRNNSLRFLICAAALALFWPTARAQDSEEDDKKKLAYVRDLPFKGEWPTLSGFSPAQPVEGFAPQPGDHGHTQAYRSANGCVAFFYPLGTASVSDVAFKWNGLACNGKPIEGQGELQIRRGGGNDTTVIGAMKGNFSRGVLTGKGVKANFVFDKAGKPILDTYHFQGEFANSILHGGGAMLWTGAPGDRPAAWLREGEFHEGRLRGGVRQSRLRPYPGVEGEVQSLVFHTNGKIINNQAAVNGGKPTEGTLFFEGDPIPWQTELYYWINDQPTAALFAREDESQRRVMRASCEEWNFGSGALTCSKGMVLDGFSGHIVAVESGGFSIPLPTRGQRVGFRPDPSTQVLLKTSGVDKYHPVRCDTDMARCTGKGVIPMSSSGRVYWHGDLEWRDGAVLPLSASLYQVELPPRPSYKVVSEEEMDENPEKVRREQLASAAELAAYKQAEEAWSKLPFDPGNRDKPLARCERFDGPLSCAQGAIFSGSTDSFVGAWTVTGFAYRGPQQGGRPGYTNTGDWGIARVGWGKVTFDNGAWARVRYSASGALSEVGECDKPDSSETFRCELDGTTVMFTAVGGGERRTSRRPQPERASPQPTYAPPTQGGGRFVPTPVPQRPTYVLPGMR